MNHKIWEKWFYGLHENPRMFQHIDPRKEHVFGWLESLDDSRLEDWIARVDAALIVPSKHGIVTLPRIAMWHLPDETYLLSNIPLGEGLAETDSHYLVRASQLLDVDVATHVTYLQQDDPALPHIYAPREIVKLPIIRK